MTTRTPIATWSNTRYYIIDDATKILTAVKTITLKEQIATIEETTRQEVESAVRQ